MSGFINSFCISVFVSLSEMSNKDLVVRYRTSTVDCSCPGVVYDIREGDGWGEFKSSVVMVLTLLQGVVN